MRQCGSGRCATRKEPRRSRGSKNTQSLRIPQERRIPRTRDRTHPGATAGANSDHAGTRVKSIQCSVVVSKNTLAAHTFNGCRAHSFISRSTHSMVIWICRLLQQYVRIEGFGEGHGLRVRSRQNPKVMAKRQPAPQKVENGGWMKSAGKPWGRSVRSLARSPATPFEPFLAAPLLSWLDLIQQNRFDIGEIGSRQPLSVQPPPAHSHRRLRRGSAYDRG